MGPLEQKIYDKLFNEFQPSQLNIINESHKHAKHAGIKEMHAANPETAANSSESHFRMTIQSEKFDGINRLNRQRMILDLIKDEMKLIHAFAMTVKGSGE